MRKLVLFLLVLLYFSNGINAQHHPEQRVQVSPESTSIKQLVESFEEKHPLRFFYFEDWISNTSINISGNTNLQLGDFLKLIQEQTPMKVLLYNEFYIILYRDLNEEIIAARLQEVEDMKRVKVGTVERGQNESTSILRGVIRDGKTGEPLPGASIRIGELNKGTTSNPNGYYQLEIPKGRYELRVSFVGLSEESRQLLVLSSGSLDVDLFEKTILLSDLTFSGRRDDANITSFEKPSDILNIKTIQKMPPLLGEVDLVRSVLFLPGVSTAGEGATGFNVRGGNVDQNLVLYDGVQVFNPAHLFGFMSGFNPESIESVQLYRSGIPARFGGRGSSVLDVQTRNGNRKKFGGNGGIGLVTSKLNLEGPIIKDKLSFLVGGRSIYSNWFLRSVPNVAIRNSEAFFYDLNAKVSGLINDKNAIEASFYHSYDDFAFSADTLFGYSNSAGQARWTHLLNDKVSLGSQISFSNYRYFANTPEANLDAFALENGISTTGLHLYATWTPNLFHNVDAGIHLINYRIQQGNIKPLGDISSIENVDLPMQGGLETSIYIQDEWNAHPKLKVLAGMRLNHYQAFNAGPVYTFDPDRPRSIASIIDANTQEGFKPSTDFIGLEPRLSLNYIVNPDIALRASYHRMRQNVQLISNTTAITPQDIWQSAGPYLKPLIVDQLALGISKNMRDNSYEFSGEMYYRDMQQLADVRDGTPLLVNEDLIYNLLNGNGRAYGIEMIAKKQAGKLTGWISYTYSRSLRTFDSPFQVDQISFGREFASNFDKPHDANVVAIWQFTRRMNLSGNFTYSTGRPVTVPEAFFRQGGIAIPIFTERNNFRLPDYHRLDISFTIKGDLKKKKNIDSSWTLAVYNLYGRKNPYSLFFVNSISAPPVPYVVYILGRPFPSISYNFTF